MPEEGARMDAQSAAFREATPADRVRDHEIAEFAERIHYPIHDVGVLKTPDDYDAEQWDAARAGPKDTDQARAQLAARIADPSAPDGPEVANAYDADGGSE